MAASQGLGKLPYDFRAFVRHPTNVGKKFLEETKAGRRDLHRKSLFGACIPSGVRKGNKMERHFLKEVLHWRSVCATLLLSILFLLATFTGNAHAQDQYDPPGRVARLGYMQGAVSFEPAGESDWVEAVPNRPITTGIGSGQTANRVRRWNWVLPRFTCQPIPVFLS